MARIERLRVYPVKGIEGVDVQESRIRDGGTLAWDREFALFDEDDTVFNAKRSDRFHELSTGFDIETGELAIDTGPGEVRRFALESGVDRLRAEEWFSDFFGTELTLERDGETGFVDRTEMGPSVVSTATLSTVAGWFDDVTTDGARRRIRANVEVSGVPAFWEDRFLGADAPAFEAGGVRFEGVTPCGRCVVPQRDPDTGEPLAGFREQFVEKRRETFPEWADPEAFDHFYSLMLIARIPERDRGETVRVDDPVEVVED